MTARSSVESLQANPVALRIMSGLVVLIASVSLSEKLWLLLLFLSFDFLLRGMGWAGYSPLFLVAERVALLFCGKRVAVSVGPKKFAAKLGFLLCVTALLCTLTGLERFHSILCLVLISCALLESLFSVCLGCYLYALAKRFGFAT